MASDKLLNLSVPLGHLSVECDSTAPHTVREMHPFLGSQPPCGELYWADGQHKDQNDSNLCSLGSGLYLRMYILDGGYLLWGGETVPAILRGSSDLLRPDNPESPSANLCTLPQVQTFIFINRG